MVNFMLCFYHSWKKTPKLPNCFLKLKKKKKSICTLSLYKVFNLVFMETMLSFVLVLPHMMWCFIEMAWMGLRMTAFGSGQHPLHCVPLAVNCHVIGAGQSLSCWAREELYSTETSCWNAFLALSRLRDPETHRQLCRECFPNGALLCVGVWRGCPWHP